MKSRLQMSTPLTRRSFLRNAALTTAALSVTRFLHGSNLLAADAGRKLNIVSIAAGGRAMNHIDWVVNQSKDNLLAVVDPDEKRHQAVKKWFQSKQLDCDKVQMFTDYRVMFDNLGKQLDAVIIATPNHQHALPSMLAMDLDKAVYCEKPLTHDIAEARKLREMASKSKAPTQMGNQGHCEDGYRRLCEFVNAGVVGKITETHSWTDRANGGVGPRPPYEPVPEGMHWDEWIGPAPYRDFHSDIHPHEWHGWYDFGNGSLGNMGCHVLDGVFWALKLQHPTSFECEEIRQGSDERYPTGSRIRWDFPARGDMPAVKVYWYEGLRKDTQAGASGNLRLARGADQNLPPLFAELRKQYPDEEFESNGTFYVGEKGVLYTGTYGGRMRLVPREKSQEIAATVPKTLPRTKNVITDFLDACREGRKDTAASFDYGAQLTEFTLLGNLAQYAGVGKKLEWDGPKMRIRNYKELNRWVKRPYRKGWKA
jgi:predicted dehydrogenase